MRAAGWITMLTAAMAADAGPFTSTAAIVAALPADRQPPQGSNADANPTDLQVEAAHDQVAAVNQWLTDHVVRQPARFTGKVQNVAREVSDRRSSDILVTLALPDGPAGGDVVCRFPATDGPRLLTVNADARVTIAGTVDKAAFRIDSLMISRGFSIRFNCALRDCTLTIAPATTARTRSPR